MRKIIYLAIVILSIDTLAIAKSFKECNNNEIRAFAMQECLNINYIKLGAYKREDLHDYSFWAYDFTVDEPLCPEKAMNVLKFTSKRTENFYKESLPIKADGAKPPFTAIFAKCITFYESKELKEFVKNAKP